MRSRRGERNAAITLWSESGVIAGAIELAAVSGGGVISGVAFGVFGCCEADQPVTLWLSCCRPWFLIRFVFCDGMG